MFGRIMSGQIEALETKKDIPGARIQQEHVRPQPDSMRLPSFKRMRLRLRDDLVRIQWRAARAVRPGRHARSQLTAAFSVRIGNPYSQ